MIISSGLVLLTWGGTTQEYLSITEPNEVLGYLFDPVYSYTAI